MQDGLHVLLVEDNEGDIVLTQEAFDERKIINKLSVARNGEEAIEFLLGEAEKENSELPDLVLLDLNLPVKNGFEVLQALKEKKETKSIPVIILTTSSSQMDVDSAYNLQANSYITKPLEIDDFIQAVVKIEEFWLQLIRLPKNVRKRS